MIDFSWRILFTNTVSKKLNCKSSSHFSPFQILRMQEAAPQLPPQELQFLRWVVFRYFTAFCCVYPSLLCDFYGSYFIDRELRLGQYCTTVMAALAHLHQQHSCPLSITSILQKTPILSHYPFSAFIL